MRRRSVEGTGYLPVATHRRLDNHPIGCLPTRPLCSLPPTGGGNHRMADRSSSIARSLLLAYTAADPATIRRLVDELAGGDPDLVLLVLDRLGRVSATLLQLIGERAGINIRRAIEDAFDSLGPTPGPRA